MKSNIIQLVLLSILILMIFSSWLFSPIIASGDWWYYFPSMFHNASLSPQAWSTFTSVNGLGGQGYAYIPTYLLISISQFVGANLNLSWEFISRFLFFIPFILITTASSVFLIRKLFPKNYLWIFSPLIFVLNSYVLMLVGGGQIFTGISYGLMPLSIYLSIEILRMKSDISFRSILITILLSICLSLQCLFDLRIAFITGVAIGIYLLVLLVFRELRIKNLLFLLSSFVIATLINFYWIAPLIFLGVDPIRQLGENYSSTRIVEFLSFAKLENSIGLLHPYFPENIFGKVGFMRAEFLLLPIIAFSSLFFIKRKNDESKYVLFFALIGVIGIFLGKGACEPLGDVYLWLFSNVPGFQLFRDSFKWYALIALSYSVLIPFTIHKIYYLISSKDKISKSNIFNLSNMVLLILFLYLLFLIRPGLFNNLPGTFQKKELPKEYIFLNAYLSADNSFHRSLWVPNTQLFGYFSNNHPQISARDFFDSYDQEKLINIIEEKSSEELLSDAGVKYVVIPQDSENEIYLTDRKYDEKKYLFIKNNLEKIPWLTKKGEFGKIIVFETKTHKQRFWCDCDAKISYRFIKPTKYEVEIKNAKKGDKLIFSEQFDPNWVVRNEKLFISSSSYEKRFNSFDIPKGNYKFEVYYKSQDLIDKAVIVSFVALFSTTVLLIVCLFKIKWK